MVRAAAGGEPDHSGTATRPHARRDVFGWDEHIRVAAEDFRRCGKPTYLAGLREISRIVLRPRLGQVAVPTLVLCGSKDRANIPLTHELAAESRARSCGSFPTPPPVEPPATGGVQLTVGDFVDQTEAAEV
jgi:pimeloyl-ACP methyl ester carboxylesterase